jgi:hypothetical protein
VWPLTTPAQRALAQSHSITVRATAYGIFGTQEIPVGGGQVVSDAGSQVRRTATLETSLALWPVDPRSIIQVTGTEIQVDYGIVIPGVAEPEWVPLIRGLLSKASRTRPIPTSGTLPLQLVDRAAKVAQDKFLAPAQTVSSALTTAEIRRLIQESLGVDVPVVDRTGSTKVAPVLEIEKERWADGVERLSDSIGAEVFFDPQGSGVIRYQPTLSDAPVWVVASGSGGALVERGDELDREGVYNGVVVTGERTDGTAPVTATVWDTDPTSPTYYLGPFGRKPRSYSSPLLTTVAQCQAAGAAILARYKGANAKVSISMIVNPALEAGDVITLRDEGASQLHIIDKVTVPLSPAGAQPLETRSLDLEVA